MLHSVQTLHFHLRISYPRACLFHQLVLFISFLISYHIPTRKTNFSSGYFAQQLCYFILSFQPENKSCSKPLSLIAKDGWVGTVPLGTHVILNTIRPSKAWNQTREKPSLVVKAPTVGTGWEEAASFKTSAGIGMTQIRRVAPWKIWMQQVRRMPTYFLLIFFFWFFFIQYQN